MQELNGFDDFETSNVGDKTVNFGSGLEYLMNDRKKPSSNINIDLGELDRLEDELNELNNIQSSKSSNSNTKSFGGFAQNLFGFNSEPDVKDDVIPDSKLGNATANSVGNASNGFEGFSKMNDPVNDSASKSSEREKRRKKRMMIKKLEEWNDKGFVKNSNSHCTLVIINHSIP